MRLRSTLNAPYSMRLISGLSVVLTSFARFEFRKHVEDGQLKSKSVFTELKEMQDPVLEMTRAFKHHLDGRKETFGGHVKSSPYTMVVDSRIPSSIPRLPFPGNPEHSGSIVGGQGRVELDADDTGADHIANVDTETGEERKYYTLIGIAHSRLAFTRSIAIDTSRKQTFDQPTLRLDPDGFTLGTCARTMDVRMRRH
jgi:hypothetical protein